MKAESFHIPDAEYSVSGHILKFIKEAEAKKLQPYQMDMLNALAYSFRKDKRIMQEISPYVERRWHTRLAVMVSYWKAGKETMMVSGNYSSVPREKIQVIFDEFHF